MQDVTSTAQDLYGHGEMLDRIIAALKSNGADPEHPSCEDLHACDQMHARGIEATREHAAYADIKPGMRVLEIGCGIGGASRYLAEAMGCRVSAIDITPECIDVARELTRRCGLGAKIEFRQADATELPFGNTQFDHVWSHNVTMNIKDKAKLTAEVARVLKPGGHYSCWELAGCAGKAPYFPLPWASDPSSSFLATPEDMIATIERGGLKLLRHIDLNPAYLAYLDETRKRAEDGGRPATVDPQALRRGDDFMTRLRNCGRSAREGRLVDHLIIAGKPRSKS